MGWMRAIRIVTGIETCTEHAHLQLVIHADGWAGELLRLAKRDEGTPKSESDWRAEDKAPCLHEEIAHKVTLWKTSSIIDAADDSLERARPHLKTNNHIDLLALQMFDKKIDGVLKRCWVQEQSSDVFKGNARLQER